MNVSIDNGSHDKKSDTIQQTIKVATAAVIINNQITTPTPSYFVLKLVAIISMYPKFTVTYLLQ